MHDLSYQEGTDARNHVAKCSCGWAGSETYLGVRDRGNLHKIVFADEDRLWRDPRRQTVMPPASGKWG